MWAKSEQNLNPNMDPGEGLFFFFFEAMTTILNTICIQPKLPYEIGCCTE